MRPVFRLLVPALLLAACGDPVGPGSQEIIELPRALTSAEKVVIQSGNTFGLELIRQAVARDTRPNVILSPLSASMALGMTMNGAANATFDAMRSTLGFGGLSQAEINDSYRTLLDVLTKLDPDVRFDIANSVWANKDLPFYTAFLEAVQAAFDATVQSRDFADAATLEAINSWVKANTNGYIEKILDRLDPGMAAILINAMYFEASWTTRFDPAKTTRDAFTREDGSSVQVDMMNLSDVELPFTAGADYTAVELPYGGQAFSMVVVAPTGATTARSFLQGLDEARWEQILQGLAPLEVDQVSLPKFTLAFDTYLNDALIAMGMGPAFRPGADFSKMSPAGNLFCIDYVRQKTYVEVDEQGTKAAAVTAVGMRKVSFTGLIADRPFVFAIRERLSGTLLFVGLVGDPTFKDSGEGELGEGCR